MEGKLAETASNRPLALTIGAAAVTLLVILGVLTGPTIATCFNSPDGMGQCLRGKMTEVGLIPASPATAVAEADAPAEQDVASAVSAPSGAEETGVTPEPELDTAAPDSGSDAVIAATFGLLRAEPDGSVVIAGSGTPGSEVQVFANSELLGSITVEPSGDWVIVPDAPLPPGNLEITLGEAGKTGEAAQSFIVVIDEDKTTQPLVVASTPGEASEVLQGLTAPAPVSEPDIDVAVADEPAPADEPAQGESPSQSSTAVTAPSATTPEPAPAVEPAPVASESAETETAAPASATTSSDEPETASAPANVQPSSADQSEVSPLTASQTPDANQPDAPAAQSAAEPAAEATPPTNQAQSEPNVATVTPATEPDTVAQAADDVVDEDIASDPAAEETVVTARVVPPTIDAIEIEGDRTFFAGAGPDNGTVRLYVDDQFVADADVEDGRWLVEAGPVLDEPNQRVRADLLEDGGAAVTARAEVDFIVDVPEVEEPVAVAQAPEAAQPEPVAPAVSPEPEPVTAADPAPISEPAPTSPAAPAAPTVQPAPSAPAAEPAPVAPAAPETAPEPTPVPATETAQAAEPASTPGAPALEPASAPEPQEPPAVAIAEPEVPTMVAVSLGDPEAQRFASGKAIIRRGDNLWTIARRVYGEGIKYTTIYDANTGQIRDPDRIYPGQVFDLPEGLQ